MEGGRGGGRVNACDSECGVKEIADGGKWRVQEEVLLMGDGGYMNATESRSNHDNGGYT